jgi:hypothetical protein
MISDLIEVKVPANLLIKQTGRNLNDDGEIQMPGYTIIMLRKLQNDTLILLCIPNTDKMKLFNARETFFLINDMQQNENGKHHPLPAKPIKILMSEYVSDLNNYSLSGIQII